MRIFKAFLFLIFISSCSQSPDDKSIVIIDLEDFEEINLTSKKYFFEEVVNAGSMAFSGNKILISEYHNVPDETPRIHIINPKNWTYEYSKGRFGNGPLEIFDPLIIPSSDTISFWVFDFNNKKFSSFNFQDTGLLADSDKKNPDPSLRLIRHSFAPNRNMLAVTIEGESKIYELDPNGNFIGKYGEYEKLEDYPDLSQIQLGLLSAGRFGGNQENGKYVKTSLHRDLFEIFDYETKRFISVIGPDLSLPKFEFHSTQFGEVIDIGPEVPSRYGELFITRNRIFVAYSGYSYLDYAKNGSVSKEIRVFDLKGKPLTRIFLDRSISKIAINEETNELYGLTTDQDPGIAVFQLPMDL